MKIFIYVFAIVSLLVPIISLKLAKSKRKTKLSLLFISMSLGLITLIEQLRIISVAITNANFSVAYDYSQLLKTIPRSSTIYFVYILLLIGVNLFCYYLSIPAKKIKK